MSFLRPRTVADSGLGNFLGRLVSHLDAAHVSHMVAGSVASSVHGEPRSTQDIDLVVDPSPSALACLVRTLLAADFYVSEDAAILALKARRQFNVIDLETGWKADLIVRKDRPFSASEFARRQPATVLGVQVHIATAEDVVLAKLEWAKKGGGSERQLRDVRGILDAHAELDTAYLEHWAAELGVTRILEDVQR